MVMPNKLLPIDVANEMLTILSSSVCCGEILADYANILHDYFTEAGTIIP